MKIQKIPLQARIRGLQNGCAAHREYIPALLTNFAEMSIADYLIDYPEDLERLADLVRYPAQYMPELSYADVAVRVRDMYRLGVAAAWDAMEILAKPMNQIYQKHLERMNRNE